MITARASPAEDDLIQARADLAGLPKATYVRQAALAGPAETPAADPGPAAELRAAVVDGLVRAAAALLEEGAWAAAGPEAKAALARELDRLALLAHRALGRVPR